MSRVGASGNPQPVAQPQASSLLAPAAETAVAGSPSAAATTAATAIGAGVAATTLTSDSPTNPEDQKRRDCQQANPWFIPCEYEISMEEQVIEFIMRQGYSYKSLGSAASSRSSNSF
jgi:hypothetical protein